MAAERIAHAGSQHRRTWAALTRRYRRAAFPLGMAAPAVVAAVVIMGFPVAFNLYLSFTNASALTGIADPDFVGLRNYETVFRDPRFQRALGLTFIWTIANLALQLGLGLLLALLLHDTRGRAGTVLRALWVLPWLLPAASAFYVWRLVFNPEVGQVGGLLAQLGISRNVIGDPSLALWSVIIAGAWKGFPFYMLMFYSGLASVDRDLYDAARVDGASRWVVFRHIEMPEIRAIASLAGLLGFVWIFNWMTPLLIMTEGGPGGATTTLGVWIWQEAIRGFRLANAAVASTVLVGVVLLFLAAVFVYRIRRERRLRAGHWSA